MDNGFLAIETHRDKPELVRFYLSDTAPAPNPTDTEHRLRYVARFNDRDAALMHTHELIKRRLLDPDTHIYRVSLARAVAAVESLDLKHQRIYLDPDLDADETDKIAEWADRFIRLKQFKTRIFDMLGYIAVGLLLFNLFLLSLA